MDDPNDKNPTVRPSLRPSMRPNVSGEGAAVRRGGLDVTGPAKAAPVDVRDVVGAVPTVAAATLRSTATDDPIGDALCDEYLDDQQLWPFGELADLRALAPRAVTKDRRGARAFDGAAIYVVLLSRRITEPAAQAFILRVEARLARVGIPTVLPAPLLRLTAAQRDELLKPPALEPEPPPVPPAPVARVQPEAAQAPAVGNPKEIQAQMARQQGVLRIASIGFVVALAAVGGGLARAMADVTVTRSAVLRAPAAAVWDVVAGLEHQMKVLPWLQGATAPKIEGDVLRATLAGEEVVVRKWGTALGQRVEMRLSGARTLSSKIELVEQEDGQAVTWTVTGPRGTGGVFADVAGEREQQMIAALTGIEAGANALVAERAAAEARAAAAEAAMLEIARKNARPEIEDPGGEGGDEHEPAPEEIPGATEVEAVGKPPPLKLEVEEPAPRKITKKKPPKRRR